MSLLQRLRELLARPDATDAELEATLTRPGAFADTQPELGGITAEPAELYPLSRIATAAQVSQVGITNGMTAEQVEQCLARVMSA